METYNKIMEKVYLIAGILTLILVTYNTIKNGGDEAYYFLFPIILLGMYVMRRYMRKRMEKLLEDKAREAQMNQKD